jgi:hypothetical protein
VTKHLKKANKSNATGGIMPANLPLEINDDNDGFNSVREKLESYMRKFDDSTPDTAFYKNEIDGNGCGAVSQLASFKDLCHQQLDLVMSSIYAPGDSIADPSQITYPQAIDILKKHYSEADKIPDSGEKTDKILSESGLLGAYPGTGPDPGTKGNLQSVDNAQYAVLLSKDRIQVIQKLKQTVTARKQQVDAHLQTLASLKAGGDLRAENNELREGADLASTGAYRGYSIPGTTHSFMYVDPSKGTPGSEGTMAIQLENAAKEPMSEFGKIEDANAQLLKAVWTNLDRYLDYKIEEENRKIAINTRRISELKTSLLSTYPPDKTGLNNAFSTLEGKTLQDFRGWLK